MTNRSEDLVKLGFSLGGKTKITSSKTHESKWTAEWKAARLFEAKPDGSKPKFFICVPYSYQNGPLHLGHGFTFTRGDVIARYKRMRGFNVLFPWAWHWTGEAVAGTSERLRRGDQSVRKMLVEIDGVSEELLPYFENPEFICAYYTAENRQVVDAIGWSVDWTREFYTTSLHPYYNRFIEWQYSVLASRGLVSKGRHPVVWCPRCQSATGDHDRLRGEGIYPEEFTLVFFDMDGVNLVAATLRPETLYGATNLWVNPEATYEVLEKNGRRFLVSREAVVKFREQWQDVSVKESILGRALVGKTAKAPLTGWDLIILPAEFVDPSLGTGVVYSVPAHAPYDYVALRDLRQSPETLKPYGINPSAIADIKPVKVVSVEGFGDFPAVELVEKMGIRNQLDEKLEEATREIYSKEFHTGVMYVDELKGMAVSQARMMVQQRLVTEMRGDIFFDLSGKVVCRSGDECIVKIVEDQWFLTFSNLEWKKKVKAHIAEMGIYPEAAKTWFLNVVDWLKDWACTRKTGLGTPLPWDPSWKIETLSDSTIYPALYTISGFLNRHPEFASKLRPEVLNYVFLGIGDPAGLASRYQIDNELLESMRKEFVYWYGVDLRVSAKDLVPNHLTFYLFHHTGIFDKNHWPRSISVNGMISIEGEKMSKSKGNFITLKTAVQRHGADATRLALMLSAEDLDDPDWRTKNVEEAEQFIQNF
ncbi:MAG: leucine--tRNA ligase, partial [Candidatus Caldarchaeum sp.]|nr:leucine--tRNA ligase [Candidatus Caldarchaeum sp.]